MARTQLLLIRKVLGSGAQLPHRQRFKTCQRIKTLFRLGKGDYGVMQTSRQSQSCLAPWDDARAHDAYILRQGETHATP